MILLKARAERMQKRHEKSGCRLNSMNIYDQCGEEEDSRSTSSLTKLEGLKMMAKSSITNTFESLFKVRYLCFVAILITFFNNLFFKKMNKNYVSTESLQGKSPQEVPSSPSYLTAQTSFEFKDQRRNTLADCCPETMIKTPNQEALKKELLLKQMEKSASLGKSEQKSLLNIFMKVSGSQTKLNSLEELSQNLNQLECEQEEELSKNIANRQLSKMERQSSVNTQLRHKLFKCIKKSIHESRVDSSKISSLQNVQKSETVSKRAKRRNPRDLWLFAVRQQILLIKMNKQNAQNEGTKMAICDSADRIEYQAIPRLQSSDHLKKITATWDRLIKSYHAKEPSSNFEEEIYRAIVDGVPRSHKGIVWQFVAQFRRKRRLSSAPFNSCTSEKQSEPREAYRSLLKELTVQQHAIFVDLGRTFPGVTFFAETMGYGQLSLFNLLKAYSLYDKEVEYCQGLSFVAGILLLHVSSQFV